MLMRWRRCWIDVRLASRMILIKTNQWSKGECFGRWSISMFKQKKWKVKIWLSKARLKTIIFASWFDNCYLQLMCLNCNQDFGSHMIGIWTGFDVLHSMVMLNRLKIWQKSKDRELMVEWLVEYDQITNFKYQCWEAMVCYQKFGPLLFHHYDIFSSKISIFQNLEIFLGDFKSVVFARYFPTTWTFMFIFEVKSGSGSKSFEIWQKKNWLFQIRCYTFVLCQGRGS